MLRKFPLPLPLTLVTGGLVLLALPLVLSDGSREASEGMVVVVTLCVVIDAVCVSVFISIVRKESIATWVKKTILCHLFNSLLPPPPVVVLRLSLAGLCGRVSARCFAGRLLVFCMTK